MHNNYMIIQASQNAQKLTCLHPLSVASTETRGMIFSSHTETAEGQCNTTPLFVHSARGDLTRFSIRAGRERDGNKRSSEQ